MLSVLTMFIWLVSSGRHVTVTAEDSSSQREFEEYYWSDWTGWSSCDRLCARDQGTKSRIRICFRVANNQRLIGDTRTCEARLDGRASDENECYEPECDGSGSFTATWSSWEPWICSYNVGICGRGTKTRIRHCSNPDSASLGGGQVSSTRCPRGKPMEEGECFAKCPEQLDKYGGWSDWSPWICERDCEPDVEAVRTRACDNPPPVEGYTCPGENQQAQPCDGLCSKNWGEWGEWTTCTKTCDQPLRVRKRKCQGIGMPCQGEANEKSECLDTTRHTLCPPVDGGWSVWTHWTEGCSVTCSDGVKIRQRECNRPPQAGLGQDCAGAKNETRPCTIDVVCPIHGEWRSWSVWASCTATCGGGEGTRTRSCRNPKFGGRPCEGDARENGPCNTQTCPPPTVPPALETEIEENLLDADFSFVQEEGEIVEMSCTDMAKVQRYYPEARMEWLKNGQTFQLDGLRVRIDRKTLVFEEVNGDDNGVYLCRIDYGGVEELTVGVFSLAVRTSHAQVFAREGQDFNLTCNGEQLGLLFDGCTQKWFKDERAVKSYGDTPPQKVNMEVFRHIDDRFAGSYSCVVYHSQTDRQWTTNIVNVTVLPPLDLVEVLWNKAQANLKIVGGVSSGVVILFVILVTMLVFTCRSGGDKKAKTKSKTTPATAADDGNPDDHVALYDDGDNNYGNNDYSADNYDNSSYQQSGYDDYNYDY